MPIIGNITVRQTGGQARVQTISYGGGIPPGLISEINSAYNQANNALSLAQASYNTANSTLLLAQASYNTANNKVDKAGDTMTGTLIVEQPAEVIATIDGGEFL